MVENLHYESSIYIFKKLGFFLNTLYTNHVGSHLVIDMARKSWELNTHNGNIPSYLHGSLWTDHEAVILHMRKL